MKRHAWLRRIDPALNHAWAGRWKAGTVEPGRYLYDHELVVVTEGSCRMEVGPTTLDLRAGQFLIVPPGVHHATGAGAAGVRRCCLHFDWLPVRTSPRGPSWTYHPRRPRADRLKKAPAWVPRSFPAGDFAAAGPALPLLEAIFHRWQTGDPLRRLTARLALHELLLHLLWGPALSAPPRRRARLLAHSIKDLLDRSAAQPGSIQALLPTLGFHYAHLCRVFRKAFGLSPVQYRNALRLEKARLLLLDPGRSVAEVARAAGFDDPAYFNRCYRRHYGVPPGRSR